MATHEAYRVGKAIAFMLLWCNIARIKYLFRYIGHSHLLVILYATIIHTRQHTNTQSHKNGHNIKKIKPNHFSYYIKVYLQHIKHAPRVYTYMYIRWYGRLLLFYLNHMLLLLLSLYLQLPSLMFRIFWSSGNRI